MLSYLALSGIHTNVESESDGSGKNQSPHQFNANDELHAEAESSAKISHENELHQVVDSTVDPSTSLGEEDRELFRDGCFANGLGNEDLLAFGESSKHEC